MERLKFAISTRALNLPIREVIRQVSESRASGIQLDIHNDVRPGRLSDSGRRQLLREAAERQVEFASLWLPLRRPLFDEEYLDERVAAVRAGLDFAFQLKAHRLCLRIGRIPAIDSAEYGLLLEVVNDLARHGNHVGAELCVIPMGDAADVLSAFLSECKAGPIGIDFDPGGMVMYGQSPQKMLRDLHTWVRHVQLRDGLRDIDGSGEEAVVGRGEVVWDEFLATLSEAEYHGWMTAVRQDGDDRLGDMLRAVTYIHRVLFDT